MVSAGGRLFYIFDEGLTGVTPDFLPEKWTLSARDAFNGILLWKRPLDGFRGKSWNNRSLRGIPGWVRRLMVAEGDKLYMPLALDSPVSIINAATGEVLATLQGTEGARELRITDGTLLVQTAPSGIAAFDAAGAKRLWRADLSPRPGTLAAARGKAFFLRGPNAVCLDLKTGDVIWKTNEPRPLKRSRSPTLVIPHGDRVLVADRRPAHGSGRRYGQANSGRSRQRWPVAANCSSPGGWPGTGRRNTSWATICRPVASKAPSTPTTSSRPATTCAATRARPPKITSSRRFGAWSS